MTVQTKPNRLSSKLIQLGTFAFPIYYYHGTDCGLLIEGGCGASGNLAAEQLDIAGFDLNNVEDVVALHSHGDHILGIHALKGLQPGLKTRAHANAINKMKNEKLMSIFHDEEQRMAELLVATGEIEPRHAWSLDGDKTMVVDGTLAEGDRIDLGGDDVFEVFETPGHSDCSISLYHAADKLLFVSDAVGMYYPPGDQWWNIYFDGYDQAIATVERLAALEVETLAKGHNQVLKGRDLVEKHFADCLAFYKTCHEHIVAEYKAGKSRREISGVMGSRIYKHYPYMSEVYLQKNCNLTVKRSLEAAGIDYE